MDFDREWFVFLQWFHLDLYGQFGFLQHQQQRVEQGEHQQHRQWEYRNCLRHIPVK